MKRIHPAVIAATLALAWGAPALAADTTAQNAAKPAASRTAAVGEYVDDAVITSKIKTAVFQDSTLKATEINVETHQGIVQLTGFVKSRADINQAVRLARGIKGVKSIKNDMVVKGRQ